MGIGKIGDLSERRKGLEIERKSDWWKSLMLDKQIWSEKKKIGVDLNGQIMREGNRRLDFIQKEMGIRQIGDLT